MGATLTKAEWERKAKKGRILCGEKKILQKAHLRAGSRGGTQIEPMCPTHHTKYDKGLCTDTELRIIGITRAIYRRWVPKKRGSEKKANAGEKAAIGLDKVQTFLANKGYAVHSKKRGFDLIGVMVGNIFNADRYIPVAFNNESKLTAEYVIRFKRKVNAYYEKICKEYSFGTPYVEGLIAYTGTLSKEAPAIVKSSKPKISFKKL